MVSPATDPGAGRPTTPDPQPKVAGITVAQNVDPPANQAGELTDARREAGCGPATGPRHRGRHSPGRGRGRETREEDANPEEPAEKDEPEPEPEDVVIGNAKVQPNVPLDKLLKSPELYSGQFVSLERVYCIGDIGGPAARRFGAS